MYPRSTGRHVVLAAALLKAACATVPGSLAVQAAQRSKEGNLSQAYVDYRAAMHFQILPSDPAWHAAKRDMEATFHRWVDARIAALRASAASNPGGTLNGLLDLLAPDLGEVPWGKREREMNVDVRPRITDAQRASIERAIGELVPALERAIDQARDAGRRVEAANAAMTLALARSGDSLVRVRAERLRLEAARQQLELVQALPPEAPLRDFHDALARYFAGESVQLAWDHLGVRVEGSEQHACAALHQVLRDVIKGPPEATLEIRDERCELVETPRQGKEEVIVGYKKVSEPAPVLPGEQCRYEAGSHGYMGGWKGCGARPNVTVEKAIVERVDFHYLDWKVRWSGQLVLRHRLHERALPFEVAEHGTEKARADAGRMPSSLRPLRRLALGLAERIREDRNKLRDALVAELHARGNDARVRGDLEAADEADVLASRWDPTHPGPMQHLARRYGFVRENLFAIFNGTARPPRWPADAVEQERWTAVARAPEVPACDGCLSHATKLAPEYLEAKGGGLLVWGLSYLHATEPAITDLPGSAALSITGGQAPLGVLGHGWQMSGELGMGTSGGFLYDLNILPIGLATNLGPLTVGIAAGGGLGGITGGRVPFAWQVPVEARLGLRLGAHAMLEASALNQWTFRSELREDGSQNALFGDELRGSLGFHWVMPAFAGSRRGSTFYLGADYREMRGAELFGVRVGYGQSL